MSLSLFRFVRLFVSNRNLSALVYLLMVLSKLIFTSFSDDKTDVNGITCVKGSIDYAISPCFFAESQERE
jgi:hypothetical protein